MIDFIWVVSYKKASKIKAKDFSDPVEYPLGKPNSILAINWVANDECETFLKLYINFVRFFALAGDFSLLPVVGLNKAFALQENSGFL